MYVLLLLIGLASADDVVTLKKGDRAPFEGTLLSPEAAAKILVDTDYNLQKCTIDSEKNLAMQKAQHEFTLRNKESELAACTLRSTEMELLYSKQVDFLEKQAIRPSWEGPALFIAGVLTGTAMLYGSSVLVKNLGD